MNVNSNLFKFVKLEDRYMTVEELIKELQKYDGGTKIYTRSSEENTSTSDIDISLSDDGTLGVYGF